MPDPRLVSRAQRAATMLERAWERWRAEQGLTAEPLPPVSSYVGYSTEEPWGRPRVVFGVDAEDAERLATLLQDSTGWSRDDHGHYAPGHPGPALAGPPGAAPVPPDRGLDQQSLFEDMRGRIPVQGWPAEFTESRGQLNSAWPSPPPDARGPRDPVEPAVPGARGDRPAGDQPAADPRGTDRPGASPAAAALPGPDLAGADLAGADLAGQDPDGAGPSGVDLTGADASGADASSAVASGAGLPGTDLPGTDAQDSDGPGGGPSDADSPGDHAPGTPEAPDTPGARGDQNIPDAPDAPDAPDIPDSKDTPDGPAAELEPTAATAGPASITDAPAGITDTMAAELAGWAAGELPGQASARLAAWTTVGGAVARGRQQADLGGGGTATERVS